MKELGWDWVLKRKEIRESDYWGVEPRSSSGKRKLLQSLQISEDGFLASRSGTGVSASLLPNLLQVDTDPPRFNSSMASGNGSDPPDRVPRGRSSSSPELESGKSVHHILDLIWLLWFPLNGEWSCFSLTVAFQNERQEHVDLPGFIHVSSLRCRLCWSLLVELNC